MTYEELQALHPTLFENPASCPIRIVTDPGERNRVEAAVRDRLERKGLPEDLARTGVVYVDQYVVLMRDAVIFAGSIAGTYLRFCELPPETMGVAMLPRHGESLILLRHFRHATRDYQIEVPRGFGTLGLSNEENARKEIAEEIGGRCQTLTSLGTMIANSGLSGTKTALFLATLDDIGEPNRAEGIVEILRLSCKDMERMIDADKITDGFTIACYARAKLAGLL